MLAHWYSICGHCGESIEPEQRITRMRLLDDTKRDWVHWRCRDDIRARRHEEESVLDKAA